MNYLLNTITCANCLDIIPRIENDTLDGVIIDSPYGEKMGYENDETIFSAKNILEQFLSAIEPKMKRSAHIAIFWTMRNLDICIDTLRSAGFTYRRTLSMYIPSGSARPYLGWLPRTQAIVIGQKYLPKPASEFHAELAD